MCVGIRKRRQTSGRVLSNVNSTTSQDGNPLIYHLRDVVKTREAEGVAFRLRIPSLQIAMGEKIALIGKSGCGKSTLLDMLAFILQPSEVGDFHFRPERDEESLDINACWKSGNINQLGDLRKRYIGYVMQTGGLLPYLTVRENMNLCRSVLGLPHDGMVEHLAEELGIIAHLDKRPDKLSTGERQRVAIGRAVAHRPSIVIADEPTASVDPYAAEKVMSMFIGLAEEFGITVILASHAWEHMEQLGLRQLTHETIRDHNRMFTETVVTG